MVVCMVFCPLSASNWDNVALMWWPERAFEKIVKLESIWGLAVEGEQGPECMPDW